MNVILNMAVSRTVPKRVYFGTHALCYFILEQALFLVC